MNEDDTKKVILVDMEDVDMDTKLTNWENPPTLLDLKADFEESNSAHDAHTSSVSRWLDNLDGKQQVKARKGRSTIVPKLIRKQAEWRYAALSEPFLSTYDLYTLSPVTFEDKEGARQNELLLNHQINNKIDKVKFIDDYVRTGVDEGSIVVRVGWEHRSEMQEVEVPVFEMVPIEDPALAQQAIAQGQPPVQKVQVDVLIEEQEVTTVNHPTIEVCEYANVRIDPTCGGDLSKAAFVIYSFTTSMSELKKDGRYKNLDNVNIESTSVLATADYEYNDREEEDFNFKDEPRKKIVVNEYWGSWDIDGTGETKPIVASWAGDTLIRMEENPFPDQEVPFVLVQYLPVRDEVYGEPDGALIEDNQLILGAVTRGMIDILGRSANGQTGTRKDALDVTNARKFERGDDYKFNSNVDPKQAFQMGVYPEIPRSALEMLQMTQNDAESLTGVKAFHGGISGKSLGDSVGGIRSALDATAKREVAILRRMANGIKKIGRKFCSMNSEFLSDDEIIRVTNEEFVAIDRDGLACQFDMKVDVSTAEADNAKAGELSFMLQTMGNSMPPEMSQIILSDIALLRNMPELSKRISEFKPTPDPMAQKAAELEIALLEAQVMNERAKTDENRVDVGLKQAKTESERAKARNLNSQSDNEDLNFVEQESGVNREHEAKMNTQKHVQDMRGKELDNRNKLEEQAFDNISNL